MGVLYLVSVQKNKMTNLLWCCHCGCSSQALMICGGCKVLMFCSAQHQKAHWPQHASICRGIQTAERAYQLTQVGIDRKHALLTLKLSTVRDVILFSSDLWEPNLCVRHPTTLMDGDTSEPLKYSYVAYRNCDMLWRLSTFACAWRPSDCSLT